MAEEWKPGEAEGDLGDYEVRGRVLSGGFYYDKLGRQISYREEHVIMPDRSLKKVGMTELTRKPRQELKCSKQGLFGR